MTGEDREFHKVRVRFQALGAGTLRTGWVQSFQPPTILISSQRSEDYKSGDRFHFELFGGTRNASFDAVLQSPHPFWASPDAPLDGDEAWYQFKMESEIRYTAPKEDYRKCVPAVPASLFIDDEELVGKIVDISHNGAGLLVDRKMRIGDQVRIEIRSQQGGLMSVRGSVRYSRSYRHEMPYYRTGIRLIALDRYEQQRWDELLEAA